MKNCLLLFMFLISASPAWANQEIKLQGLFTGKAVVSIDGQRRIIAVGETSPEGLS